MRGLIKISPHRDLRTKLFRVGLLAAMAAGVLAAAVSPASAALTAKFAPAQNFVAGSKPLDITSADFNGDGKLDLATPIADADSVSVLLGNGKGGFGNPIIFAVGTFPVGLTSADFDGDGRPDLAVANQTSNNVSVLLNNGFGFGPVQNIAVGNSPFDVTSADFNGDDKPDLAVSNNGSNDISVLLNNGSGSFGAAQNFAVEAFPHGLTSADFDGDSRPDLAIANQGSDSVSVLLNITGAGSDTPSFETAQNFDAGRFPWAITSVDLNGDSRPDLAIANQGSDNVSVLLNTAPGGSFGAAKNFAVGSFPQGITSVDLNGDRRKDLATANHGSDTLGTGDDVSVLLGNGKGGFRAAQNFAVGNGPTGITSGKFNADRKPDLATSNQNSNDVSVLQNTTPFGKHRR